MQRVAAGIAYRAVRNHGTIGGSVALADPAADWPACLLALGASVRIAGPGGERVEPIDEFLRGAYTTSLQPGEIITAFDVPALPPDARFGYQQGRAQERRVRDVDRLCRARAGTRRRASCSAGTTTRPVACTVTATHCCAPRAVALPIDGDLRSGIASRSCERMRRARMRDAYQRARCTRATLAARDRGGIIRSVTERSEDAA